MSTGSRVADHLQPLSIEVPIGMKNGGIHDPGGGENKMRNWVQVDDQQKRAWPQAALARSSR